MKKQTADKGTKPAAKSSLGLESLGDISNLLDQQSTAIAGKPVELDVDLIDPDPDQPRKLFREESLAEMAASIEARGVKTPISVRDNPDAPGRYVINHGERRWRGSRLAGKTTVPAFIDNEYIDDDQVIENIQREALTPDEIAHYIGRKLKEGLGKSEVAKRIGKSPAFVTQHVTLLSLPAPIQAAYDEGRVSDVTVVNELAKAHKKHPEEVARWIEDEEDITRGTVRMLRDFLEQKDGADDDGKDGARAGAEVSTPAPEEKEKTAKEPDPEKLKKAIVQVRHDDRPGRLILSRRPPAPGFAWIKYDDDGQEVEANLAQVELVALVEG